MGHYTRNLFKRSKQKPVISQKPYSAGLMPVINSVPVPDKVEDAPSGTAVERLVSVAIKRGDDIHKWFRSHAELRSSLGDKNPYEPTPGDIAGFWTSEGRFLQRHQANRVGHAAGQCQIIGREFLSSDVDKW